MKATIHVHPDGRIELVNIAGVSGTACTKAAKDMEEIIGGKVDDSTRHTTLEYHKKQAVDKSITLG